MPTLAQLRKLVDKHPAPFLLDSDIEEKVFTHKGLYSLPAHVQVRSEEPADWERLAFLGDQILSMCTTDTVFERYPHARPNFLTNRRALVVSNDQIAKWSQAYGFPARIRAQPAQTQVLQSSVIAQASVFEAYVGGVYVNEGFVTAERWLKPFISLVLDEADNKAREEGEEDDDEVEEGFGYGASNVAEQELDASFAQLHMNVENLVQDEEEYNEATRSLVGDSLVSTPLSQNSLLRPGSSTPKARVRGAGSAPAMSTRYSTPASQPGSFYLAGEPARNASSTNQPSALKFRPTGGPSTIPYPATDRSRTSAIPTHYSDPLPLPTVASPTSSTRSGAAGNGFLALFNQLASQKHIDPEWTSGSTGPPHKPTFTAEVRVGSFTGRGEANNKQAAKQAAARQILRRLKWHSDLERRRPITPPLYVKRDMHRIWSSSFKARTLYPRLASLFRVCFRRLPA